MDEILEEHQALAEDLGFELGYTFDRAVDEHSVWVSDLGGRMLVKYWFAHLEDDHYHGGQEAFADFVCFEALRLLNDFHLAVQDRLGLLRPPAKTLR